MGGSRRSSARDNVALHAKKPKGPPTSRSLSNVVTVLCAPHHCPSFIASLKRIRTDQIGEEQSNNVEPALKTSLVQWSVKWPVPSFVATTFLLVWYLFMVPESQRALLALGIDTINAGTFSTVTRMALIIIITSATIIGVAYFLAFRNPTDFNLSHAMALLRLELMATGAGEYSRENAPQALCQWPLDVLERSARSLCQPYQRRRLPSPQQLDLERSFCLGTVQLLTQRGHLPWRVRLLPHPRRLSPAPSAPRRSRSHQHSQPTRTGPTRRIVASCRRWLARSRTSTTWPASSTRW